MARLLSFIDTRPQFASPKSALLVENNESLLTFLRTSLKNEGYAVRTAASRDEGLRAYRDSSPFNVVLIDYCVPPSKGPRSTIGRYHRQVGLRLQWKSVR